MKIDYNLTSNVLEELKETKKNYQVQYQGRFWALKQAGNYCSTTLKICYLFAKFALCFIADAALSLTKKSVGAVDPTHTKDGMPKIDPKAAAILYKMHKEFDEVCTRHDIRYVACSGTLLGIQRHNPPGIIPWDDDIDLMLPVGEENKWTDAFEQDLLEQGLRLRKHWGGYKITLLQCPEFGKTYGPEFGTPDDKPGSYGEFYWPFIDLFISFKDLKDGKIYINTDGKSGSPQGYPNTCWPTYSFSEQEMTHTKRVPFGPNTIPIPADHVDSHLTSYYGKDWRTQAIQQFDHRTGKCHERPKKVTLTDFSPAPYDEAFFQRNLPTSL